MVAAAAGGRPSPSPSPQEQPQPSSGGSPGQIRCEDALSVCSKLCYGIGGAPNQVASSAASFFLQIYLLDIALITPLHASLVFFIGRACGAASDPIAGFFINKSKWTKIGRLMPWLLGCTPFLIVSYFLLWYLPPFISARVVWYLVFYCLYQALSTLFQVSYSSLTMFLTTEQKDRDSATAYRMTFEVLGTLVGAALQGQIVASAHAPDHCQYNNSIESLYSTSIRENISTIHDLSHGRKLYMITAGTIGGIYLVGSAALFFGVKEKIDPYALETDRRIPFFEGHKLALKFGPYVKFTTSFLLISTAVQLEQSNFVLFCTHAADLHSHFQNLVVTILVSATLSIPFWQWFLRHFGKKSAACGISWMIPFAIMLVTIPNVFLAYMVAFVSGLSTAASMLLPWSMLPDIVDHFRVQNPHSTGHETIFYSSYVFFAKISSGIGLGISFSTLDLAGYKSRACKQSSSVVIVLKVLIGAIPAILILLGLFILYFYPINEKSRKETKYALENLRRNYPSIEMIPENEENTSM
uniref:MFSD2 lysolipid transporter B, sphingolipid n=1 Tax=Anolis carolinensis TaxID=28377 RepID=R4GCP1_ANOCA|nr:PREDICTED: major facilitator superfamily domain-containing protein 2B isoform X1 [Anolis carolinensis]|eukprot:XP_008115246.1 PREDICTED: major facilitator superfamily domain-containing protein 2B isoform X1 [Anolis carolinensis]